MNRLNKTESAVFLYCRFSLFLRDPFFQIIYCNLFFLLNLSQLNGLISYVCLMDLVVKKVLLLLAHLAQPLEPFICRLTFNNFFSCVFVCRFTICCFEYRLTKYNNRPNR